MNDGYTLGIDHGTDASWAAIAVDGTVSESFEIETDSDAPINECISDAVAQATEMTGESPAIVSVVSEERRAHSEAITAAESELDCIVTEAVIPNRRATDVTDEPELTEPEIRATKAAEKYYI